MQPRLFFIVTLSLFLALTGCRGKIFDADNIFAPKPPGLGGPDPTAPEEYLQGWHDGCETGFSTMVPSFHKMFYGYKKTVALDDNPMYYKAWKDAYTYCRQYTFRNAWDGFDTHKYTSGPLCVLCPNEVR